MNEKKKNTFFSKHFLYAYLIILIGFLIRYYYFIGVDAWFDEWNMLYTVDPTISNDETWKRYYGDRGDHILPEYYPPLYAFLLKSFLGTFGYYVENARLLSLIFGSGALILVFYLTKNFTNLRNSLIATILVSLNLFLIWQSSEIRPHSFVLFFSLLSIIFFLKLFNNGLQNRIVSILYVLFSVILLSSWPFALIIFFGKFIYLFHEFIINKKKNIYIFSCIIVSLVIYVVLNYEYLLYHLSRDEHYTKLFLGFFYSYHFRSFFGSVILGAIFLLLFGFIILSNLKKIIFNSKKENLLLFIIISSYLLTIIYSILSAPVISPKYVIFILPLIIIWMTIKIGESNIKFKNYLLIALIFSSTLNCIINFHNIPIDRPPTKKALEIISNSDTNKILTVESMVFNNFIRTNKIFVINNLSIDKIKDINLIKEDFWFLCLNNARFALGDNNLPDHKNCRSPDNTNFIVLEKQIRLPDYLLKKYVNR